MQITGTVGGEITPPVEGQGPAPLPESPTSVQSAGIPEPLSPVTPEGPTSTLGVEQVQQDGTSALDDARQEVAAGNPAPQPPVEVPIASGSPADSVPPGDKEAVHRVLTEDGLGPAAILEGGVADNHLAPQEGDIAQVAKTDELPGPEPVPAPPTSAPEITGQTPDGTTLGMPATPQAAEPPQVQAAEQTAETAPLPSDLPPEQTPTEQPENPMSADPFIDTSGFTQSSASPATVLAPVPSSAEPAVPQSPVAMVQKVGEDYVRATNTEKRPEQAPADEKGDKLPITDPAEASRVVAGMSEDARRLQNFLDSLNGSGNDSPEAMTGEAQ